MEHTADRYRCWVQNINKANNMKQLFFTGYLQVFFVAINTYFITKEYFLGMVITSFLISFIWSFNVRKVAFGSMAHRIVYSSGAALGGLSGLILATVIK